MISGSGLRTDSPDGVPNGSHVPGYAQVNIGVSHEFQDGMEKPATIRFDIINLFDKVYEIRDGSGIGVFAPQYGPRREFLVGLIAEVLTDARVARHESTFARPSHCR